MKVVAIIPARGGSKGLPGKNVKNLCGKPLIHYTVKAALDAKLVDRVIVSTDDEEIAGAARASGAEVPFMRPTELATDTATSEEVLVHCLKWLKENEGYEVDIVVYLQVTDLFRKKGMIDKCVQKLIDDPSLESAFAAYPTHKKFWRIEEGKPVRLKKGRKPRQKDKDWWYREDTGIASATRAGVLLEKGIRLGDKVWLLENDDLLSAVDIHTEEDYWVAETIVKRLKEEGKAEYYF